MKLIAIEGIDASGKNTQVALLYNALTEKGFKVLKESFPRYHTSIGELLKRHFSGELNFSDTALHMLLEADRQDFSSFLKTIEISGNYDFLLLDRYTLSNLAFGKAKGLSLDWLRNLQSNLRHPDVTFILDIETETSFKRKLKRDAHEQDEKLLSRARNMYNLLAEQLRKNEDQLIYIIDADQANPEQINEVILSYLKLLYNI